MRPSQKGWIANYIRLLSDNQKVQSYHVSLHHQAPSLEQDKKRYKIIQPTGMMYGYPVQSPINYNINNASWDDEEKMKFILLDCLINDALLLHKNEINNQDDFEECVHHIIKGIVNFYTESMSANDKFSKTRFNTKSESDQIEFFLNKRLQIKTKWNSNFWASFFQNSLLFLDIYYFGEWFRKKNLNTTFSFHEQQEKLRLNILQIIAAAAHSNNIIEEEEKALFKFFLNSANLSKENEKIASEYLNQNIDLGDIVFDNHDSWLIKKYILELALMTVWADKKLEDVEKQFVSKLSESLGFSTEEFENSLLATESFVISNWNKVHFLQPKHNFMILKDRFSNRISNILQKNQKALTQEIRESKELIRLLQKMTKENLTQQETLMVKAQLLDILKTLPTFVIVALPGTFITLPLLLNFLPKSAFPSAFSEID